MWISPKNNLILQTFMYKINLHRELKSVAAGGKNRISALDLFQEKLLEEKMFYHDSNHTKRTLVITTATEGPKYRLRSNFHAGFQHLIYLTSFDPVMVCKPSIQVGIFHFRRSFLYFTVFFFTSHAHRLFQGDFKHRPWTLSLLKTTTTKKNNRHRIHVYFYILCWPKEVK